MGLSSCLSALSLSALLTLALITCLHLSYLSDQKLSLIKLTSKQQPYETPIHLSVRPGLEEDPATKQAGERETVNLQRGSSHPAPSHRLLWEVPHPASSSGPREAECRRVALESRFDCARDRVLSQTECQGRGCCYAPLPQGLSGGPPPGASIPCPTAATGWGPSPPLPGARLPPLLGPLPPTCPGISLRSGWRSWMRQKANCTSR